MYFFYIDESGSPGKTKLYSAIGIPSSMWQSALNVMISARRLLKSTYAISTRKEFHATKLLNGRGNYSDSHKLTENEQLTIVRYFFRLLVDDIDGVKILNAYGPDYKSMLTLEYLLNRINKLMEIENDEAKLFFDEGNEKKIKTLTRKMRRYNPIPSLSPMGWGKEEMYTSQSGYSYKNIPVVHILEDPDFRESSDSYFIQLADLVAYSIYRKEEPTEKFIKNDFVNDYKILEPVLVKQASRNDPYGIVRT